MIIRSDNLLMVSLACHGGSPPPPRSIPDSPVATECGMQRAAVAHRCTGQAAHGATAAQHGSGRAGGRGKHVRPVAATARRRSDASDGGAAQHRRCGSTQSATREQ